MDEQNRKIRMATPEDPREQGHTIVGGRPAGVRSPGSSIPRGMEVIMMKAAVDPSFLRDLITRRSALAADLGIPLDPAEQAILDQVPARQLEEMARRTTVPETQKGLLMGGSAAALIALVTQLTFAPVAGRAETPDTGNQITQGLPNAGVSVSPDDPGLNVEGGHRPDVPQIPPTAGGARPDDPNEIMKTGGIRPDDPNRKMPPGGARPDIPDDGNRVTRGIRPDIPQPVENPKLPPDQPQTPVSTSPLTLDSLRGVVVRSNTAGLTFAAAIQALQTETGISIMVAPFPGLDQDKQVNVNIQGQPLGKALRSLCGEVAGEGVLYEMQVDDAALTIRFKPPAGGGATGPQPATPVQVKPDKDPYKPELTRGVRPDIPRPRGD